MKFDDTEIEEYEFHQYKTPISINDTDINKIVVYNKLPFGKQDFKYFIGYKDAKKLYFHEYSVQKWVYIDETLIKLNTCVFLKTHENFFDKYNKMWGKVCNIIKKNLIDNLYVIKII